MKKDIHPIFRKEHERLKKLVYEEKKIPANMGCNIKIFFIDFEKAYDKLLCKKLVEVLKELECGYVMLKAIVTIYRCIKFILKSVLIS